MQELAKCAISLEGLSFSAIFSTRESQDNSMNRRGKALLELYETFDLTILNGRTANDPDGEFNHVSTNENSVIDLFICDYSILATVNSLTVKEFIYSSHFPVCLQIGVPAHNINQNSRLKWNPEFNETFQNKMNKYLDESEATMNAFNNAISRSAQDASMEVCALTRLFKKPWYDYECGKAKKHLNNVLCAAKNNQWLLESRKSYCQVRNSYRRATED